MNFKWQSRRLHEHPAKHNAGTFGKIVLHDSGIYGLMVGGSHMSCPQDWAAGIHAQEEDQEETSYILKNIPQSLWDAGKKKAIDEHKSMKDILTLLLEMWVSNQITLKSALAAAVRK